VREFATKGAWHASIYGVSGIRACPSWCAFACRRAGQYWRFARKFVSCCRLGRPQV